MEVSIDTAWDAQVDQSSASGGPGGGPNTQEGKEVVRWNATRHGISSPAPVVPNLEKREDWESHLEGILVNLSPVGHLEVTLAERVALLSWRLHRVTRYETEAISLSQQKIEGDIHDRDRLLLSFRGENPYATTHPVDIRLEARHNKQIHNALKRFPAQDTNETLRGQDATSVVWSVLMAAQKQIEEEIDEESLELPGVPEDADVVELPAMKASDVRGCVEAIAAHIGEDPDELLEAATLSARLDASSAQVRAEEVEGEIDVMSRERILPHEKTLEKISRYEAHLCRQLYHALHELENLQKHRITGEGTPIARLDVQGSFSAER
jgi:hypothetical protein